MVAAALALGGCVGRADVVSDTRVDAKMLLPGASLTQTVTSTARECSVSIHEALARRASPFSNPEWTVVDETTGNAVKFTATRTVELPGRPSAEFRRPVIRPVPASDVPGPTVRA